MHAANPEVQNEMTLFHGAQTMKDTSRTGFSKNKYGRTFALKTQAILHLVFKQSDR